MSITIQNSSIDASASHLSVNVNNDSGSASLVAKPDGTLQYANKNIVKSINGISADASGNVNISTSGNLPFSNGTISYISDGCSNRRDYMYTANCNCFIYLLVSYGGDSNGLESYRFTDNKLASSIELTAGEVAGTLFGYKAGIIGSVDRIPTWNLKGEPVAMTALSSSRRPKSSSLVFDSKSKVDADSIEVTVVEKELTVTFSWDGTVYRANTMIFNSSDEGYTLTIVFDPEPTGYV